MKKKIAALDMRLQVGAVALVVVLLAVAGYMFGVAPQNAKAAKLGAQADAVQLDIYRKRAQLKAGLRPPTIKTADLFRLARAMPDQEDMPGIILTLSQVAREAGITFDLVEPSGVPTTTGSYQTQRIHLLFNGDFYGLSDFLYRLRSLVVVRNGELQATGRLFTVDTVTFNVLSGQFPQISAELFVNAFIYGTGTPTTSTPPAAASTTPSTTTPATTTPTTTTTDTVTTPAGATAAAATP